MTALRTCVRDPWVDNSTCLARTLPDGRAMTLCGKASTGFAQERALRTNSVDCRQCLETVGLTPAVVVGFAGNVTCLVARTWRLVLVGGPEIVDKGERVLTRCGRYAAGEDTPGWTMFERREGRPNCLACLATGMAGEPP